ncbi:hypothetical protein NEOLEDRAFT_1066528 [Neolentinus lepideus HHB14362 ss-1]|uniref:DUF6699 domain-containing protein n=1 Tax=Neolentinus lepideus HHB14362 ss-1 TaxID=1314782 RepID=A0A165S7E7_9AGAM|nr:hypothetical protein NEOLEDRAFT_1066528 [Neolentinus lepideus HHB14362 ss-1]
MATPPYVYAPVYYPPNPYLDPYYHQHHSPFIPPVNLQGLQPLSPPARTVHFDDGDPPVRPRVVSWHAGMPSPPGGAVPFYYTSPQPQPVPLYTHGRRHSFGNAPVMSPPWPYPPQPYPHQSILHPLLDGEHRTPPIFFDMSVTMFTPLKLTGRGSKTSITSEELEQPALWPPTTRMRIVCDNVRQWPVELQYQGNSMLLQVPGMESRPITLGNVLQAIHTNMQTQITHMDWARLSKSDDVDVARAYTRRCKAFPSLEEHEKRQGVRRVDYLKKHYMFKGLKSSGHSDGFDNFKLLIGPPDS